MSKIVKEGLNQRMHPELLRDMVSLSNNSVITNNVARILSENLDGNDLIAVREWLKLAKREQSNNSKPNFGFGNPTKRY